MNKLGFFIPGILSDPSDNFGWTDLAIRRVSDYFPGAQAQAYRYDAPAIFRFVLEGQRASEVAQILTDSLAYRHEIHLGVHSNGSDIVCRAVSQMPDNSHIHSLHIFAGACDQDCEKNRLNAAFARGVFDRLFVYASSDDDVLGNIAPLSKFLLGWIPGAAYGQLGYIGPVNQSLQLAFATTVIWKNYKHTEWTLPDNVPQLVRWVFPEVQEIDESTITKG